MNSTSNLLSVIFLGLALSVCTAQPLLCQDDELDQLKKQVAELQRRIETLEKQRVSEPVTAGTGKIKFNGLFQEWYLADNASGAYDTFRNRRLQLKFSGQVNKEAGWTIMVDPARNLTLRTTKDGNGNITNVWVNNASRDLQDAFIEWTPSDSNAKVTFGQKKIPVSYEGLWSSAKLLTIERGLYSSVEKMGDVRELGVQADLPFRNGGFTLGAFNGNGQNITEGDSSNTNGNETKDWAARVYFAPQQTPGLHLGLSAYRGKVGSTRQDQNFTGTELVFKQDMWEFWGEYLTGKKPSGSASRDLKTYYLLLAFSLDKAARSQFVARYDHLDPNTAVSNDAETDFTVGYNRYFDKHNFKWQIGWTRKSFDDPAVSDRNQWLSSFQVSF